ncbi:Aminomethyltransferase [Jannaschia rubra]|uniref:Aminomethyltransferase n=1 Tax=Jannaschia rubra TaxID=282197 RepID=A0A0M6XKP8_9RHOB|nr:Aminomethyltransferase [Jannaschia rubra]SFG54609.1 sarcosine oxidase, gamma subunit family, heterotetrameric form [Jannaschia rubra]
MSVDVGRIVYIQMLNSRAGVEADVTVTRLSETAWLMVTPAAMRVKDDAWLRRHLGDANVVITDVTAGEAVLAVMGPKSREVMRAISPGDFSTEAFPFGTAREIEAGLGFAVKTGTPADFIGRDAVLRKREEGLTRRMLQFRLR